MYKNISNNDSLMCSYFLPVETFPLGRRLLKDLGIKGNSQSQKIPETVSRLRSHLLAVSITDVSLCLPGQVINRAGEDG